MLLPALGAIVLLLVVSAFFSRLGNRAHRGLAAAACISWKRTAAAPPATSTGWWRTASG